MRKRFVGEVGERRPPPESESFAQPLRSLLGRRLVRLLHDRLEAREIEFIRRDADQVPRLLRDDGLVWSERLAELRDVVLQRIGGCPGRLCAPELVDQPVCRDNLVRTREEE